MVKAILVPGGVLGVFNIDPIIGLIALGQCADRGSFEYRYY